MRAVNSCWTTEDEKDGSETIQNLARSEKGRNGLGIDGSGMVKGRSTLILEGQHSRG